jgi:crossover junction endodeoxyribonuclease RuvC
MLILGLDISTHTGYAFLNDTDKLEVDTIHYPVNSDRLFRWSKYAADLESLLDKYGNPAIAAIEGYGYANKYSLGTLVEIGTVLRMVLYNRRIPIVEIPPNTLKRYVSGKGNVQKNQMLLEVYRRWGIAFTDDNMADAYALARAGQVLMGRMIATTPQLRDLHKVVESHKLSLQHVAEFGTGFKNIKLATEEAEEEMAHG